MKRRDFVQALIAAPALASVLPRACLAAGAPASRVRPRDAAWPSAASWERLNQATGGRLIKVRSPVDACRDAPLGPECRNVFRELKNPYYIGDDVALTQTTAWVDAWTSQPSVYAVAAETPLHVAAAVNFARNNNLRLVVRGGGHSYLGTSSAPDSLAIWTRRMNAITLHDAFVPQGCAGRVAALPAVSVGAGAIWMHTYNAVTTHGGRYVQGGGCGTVGVAGLVLGGGFGSYSKAYGTAAASLLEAEIVTADGAVRIANACTRPDLFWALKGGGGGTFGVVTRLTLRTHELPETFGYFGTTIRAGSDAAFRALLGRFLEFYADALMNPHWGEIVNVRPGRRLDINMDAHGLDSKQIEAVWQPFLRWVTDAANDCNFVRPPSVISGPARHRWDPEFLKAHASGVIRTDDRPGASPDNIYWVANVSEAGHVLYGYDSTWLPAALLKPDRRAALADALFETAQIWSIELHFQKGLAGAAPEAVKAAADTCTNPAVLDAFALAILGSEGPPAYPGLAGYAPDVPSARHDAALIAKAMARLREVAPNAGSYVNETNFFLADWQRAFWGPNYARLQQVKQAYDPAGLFFVHHGVGSEAWSADGFTRVAGR
jgi:FAD/FMN-containing dehydrogenase